MNKIIHIFATQGNEDYGPSVYALGENGVIYVDDFNLQTNTLKWIPLPALPDDQKSPYEGQ